LQIYFPNKRNVTPRYQQISLNPADRINKFQQILSPNRRMIWIHQDAWFHFKFDKESNVLRSKKEGGVYALFFQGK
jgi:hypothetical protein